VRQILDFRINMDEEYQGWILLFATLTAFWLFCIPCYCAGLSFSAARKCASYISQRLPYFYLIMCIFNATFIYLVVTWLPDWTPKDYVKTMAKLMLWLAKHLYKFMSSIVIIGAFCFAVAFKDRIALLLGLDHKTLFRCKFRDFITCGSAARFRPVEVVIWKVEDLASATIFSANNIFLEAFLGYNESMRTRVHNNAGSGCIMKETLQLNYDEDDEDEHFYLFARNQTVTGSKELARMEVSNASVKAMEMESAKKANGREVRWEEEFFTEYKLVPRGCVWLRVQPVDDDDAKHVTC